MVSLILELEDGFGVELWETEFDTAGDLIDAVKSKI
jgi:acyl carrier protein